MTDMCHDSMLHVFFHFSSRSLSLARFTQSFVCSVVLGYDLVPRLGIISMEDLKAKILRCIKDSHRPKVIHS